MLESTRTEEHHQKHYPNQHNEHELVDWLRQHRKVHFVSLQAGELILVGDRSYLNSQGKNKSYTESNDEGGSHHSVREICNFLEDNCNQSDLRKLCLILKRDYGLRRISYENLPNTSYTEKVTALVETCAHHREDLEALVDLLKKEHGYSNRNDGLFNHQAKMASFAPLNKKSKLRNSEE